MFMRSRPAVSYLNEQERGGVLSASASEISAYIATFWDRGPLDNTTTHRNPMALEWHKS